MPGFVFLFLCHILGEVTLRTGYDPNIQCFSKPRTAHGECIKFTRNKLSPITLLTAKGKVKIQNTYEMAALCTRKVFYGTPGIPLIV